MSKFSRIDSDKEFFKEAVNATAQSTGFSPSLIEKDYFCSLLLSHFFSMGNCPLIFKGGTALNKIHSGFYRLSEDLDFSIPLPIDSTRGQRSKAMTPVKDFLAKTLKEIPGFTFSSPLQGRNTSMQYIAELQYKSLVDDKPSIIKIEIGLREPLVTKAKTLMANTLLLHPTKKTPFIDGIDVNVLSKAEAYAEKLRALFCRREPAIRDLFDIKHMVAGAILKADDKELLSLARQKIAVPGNDFFGMTPERVALLKEQVDNELKPVLQEKTHREFNFDESLQQAKNIEERIRSRG